MSPMKQAFLIGMSLVHVTGNRFKLPLEPIKKFVINSFNCPFIATVNSVLLIPPLIHYDAITKFHDTRECVYLFFSTSNVDTTLCYLQFHNLCLCLCTIQSRLKAHRTSTHLSKQVSIQYDHIPPQAIIAKRSLLQPDDWCQEIEQSQESMIKWYRQAISRKKRKGVA